jgi:hypothetical protein
MPQNDKFIKDIYTLVSQNGFQGSEENALELLETNERFQQDVLKGIKAKGFNGELEDMLNLSGISLPEKKSPDEPLESSLEETSTDTTEESGAGEESFVDSSIDYVSNTVSALDRGFYKNFIGNPVKGLGTLLQGTSAKITGTDGKGVISDALIKLGTYINDTVDELAPQDEDFKNSLTDQTAQALGQVGALIATGGVSGAASKAPMLAAKVLPKGKAILEVGKDLGKQMVSPVAVSGGLSMGQSEYERAISSGATEDQAFEAFYRNAAVGSVLERVPTMQFFKRFNTVTKGGVADYLKRKGFAGFTGGLEEATTEILQGIYANKTAKEIYNVNQEIFEGVGEQGGMGFGIGFLLNALGARATLARTNNNIAEADLLDAQVEEIKTKAEGKNSKPDQKSKVTMHTPTVSSQEIDDMIDNGDLAGIEQMTKEGKIKWETIPEKTKARVPSNLLPPKVDVKQDVELEQQANEQTTENPTGVPSIDEGAESTTQPINEEAGSPTKESTNQQDQITIEDLAKTATTVSDPNKQADEITQEDIDYATSQIELGVLNWDGNPMTMRVDLGIERADVRKGEADIKRGKPNSAPAKRLIGALRDAKKRGQYDFFSGSGSNISRQNVPITEEFLGEVELTQNQVEDINTDEASLETEYNEWFNALDEESQNEILQDYEENNPGETGSDAQGRESQENVPNQTESGRGVEEERNIEQLEGYQDLIFEVSELVDTQEQVNQDPDVQSKDVDQEVQKYLDQSEFYQQATDVEKEKIFRDTQELMVKDKIPTPSANALISKDIKAQKRADLKQNTASKTKELKRVAAKKRRELKKVGDSKSAKSKKLRDEINSKYAIEASNIQEANKVQADAINAKYDAELDQLKPSDEVTFREKTGLKKQIRDLARGAKLFKKGLNEKKVELKEIIDALPWVGKLSASQTKVLINKFNKTDLLNEKAVQKFMSYTEKVLADKAFADSINNANKKRKVALKNIKRKLGTLPNSYDSFKALFSINSSLIPDSLLDSYINLNNKFGERKAVLNPGEISEATNQANKILDALDKETSEANKLQLEYDSFIKNNPQKDDVTFADKIELMKKAEVISKEEAELMEKYESIIDPKEKKTPEEDLQARKENISVITKAKRKGDDGKSIANNITNPHEKEVAENFLNLTKDKKTLEELPTNVLEHIEKIIDNIKDGFFPSYGLKLTQQMDAITRGDIMIDVIDNVPPKSRWNKFWDGFSLPKKSIQSWLTGKTVSLINIRGNILENIDETLGNFKDKKIFNNSFGSFAKSYSGYAVNSDKVNEKAIDLMNILEKEHSKDQNKIVKSKYKVWAYLMQKEYESNPGSKKVFTAKEAIDSILDYGREQGRISDQTLSKKDYEILQEIADDFLGNEDAESLYKSMSKGEKKVAGIIREVNDGLKDKTMFNGAMLGSSRPEHFNDYHHHNTLRIEGRKDKGLDDANTGSGNVGSDGTAIERISGIKPLNPDPILAMALGAKQTLREFHLKNELQTVQEGIKRLNYKYQQPEYKGTRERKQANAVRDAFKEVVDIIKEGENRNASKANVRIDRIEEFGYYSILGSVPRAAGELGTNLAYAMIANPVEYTSGIAKYKDYYMGTRGRDVMENSKSYQTTKNYGKNVRGKLGDANAFIEQEGVSKTKARADWQNKVMQITGHIKLRSATKTISKVLLTTPDMMIARPLWFGSYAAEFKRQSGKDVDYEKIADNDTDYMRENKIAIDEATKHADNQVKQSSTTNNKTLGVLKNKAREGDNALVNVYKRADRAMVNFMLYEFATAKTAVHTMMKEGSVNKRKGAALLTGIGLRMALYMPLVTAARNGFKNVLSSALGGEEEKDQEDDYLDMFKRQGLGSLMSLVLGRNMGNIGRIPISIGVEILNEEYLEGLRNGEEYDPYKHSLMYQAVTPDQLSTYKLPSTILYRFSGAYSPIIKSSIKALGGGKDVFVDNFFDKKEPTYKTSKYQKQKKAREQKHMDQAMKGAIETMGVMGIIPFYKDAKDYVGRNDFKGKK